MNDWNVIDLHIHTVSGYTRDKFSKNSWKRLFGYPWQSPPCLYYIKI